MIEWGIQVWDENGNPLIPYDHWMTRLWYSAEINSPSNQGNPPPIIYSDPLNHEPVVVQYGVGGFGFLWAHRTENGLYTGLNLIKPTGTGFPSSVRSLFSVFARY